MVANAVMEEHWRSVRKKSYFLKKQANLKASNDSHISFKLRLMYIYIHNFLITAKDDIIRCFIML